MDARFRNVRRFVNDMLKNPLGLFELAKGHTANAKQIQCIIVGSLYGRTRHRRHARPELTGKLSSTICGRERFRLRVTIWLIETSSDLAGPGADHPFRHARKSMPHHCRHPTAWHESRVQEAPRSALRETDCEKCPLCTRRDRLWRHRRNQRDARINCATGSWCRCQPVGLCRAASQQHHRGRHPRDARRLPRRSDHCRYRGA